MVPDTNVEKLWRSLNELYWNSSVPILHAVREVLLSTTDVVDPTEITYDILSFGKPLGFEGYRMITAETHIRCCTKCHKSAETLATIKDPDFRP